MMARLTVAVFLAATCATTALAQLQPGDADQTLRAMRDEMERSKARLRLGNQERPFYIEYRLLDVDVRAVSASFGALLSSTTGRNRFMSVDVRVGDYMLDSSNFIGDDFRGFIGSTGQVGIDRDYDSLRQDLWLATDQGYKEALSRLSRKRGYIQSLARQPDIPDFSRVEPMVKVEPHAEPDWTARNWEEEAKAVSAAFRNYGALNSSRVTYYLVYTTTYLMNSEGTQMRTSRSLAAIEASAETLSPMDGMGLHHIYSRYVPRPANLPAVAEVRGELERMSRELVALRSSPVAADSPAGPVLFEAPASAALLAQMLGPSISGARAPLSMQTVFEQMMERLGGRSEWQGRLNTRVLPAGVTLRDDPSMKALAGTALIGSYDVDEEGVPAEKVTIVEDGMLRSLLMSRRPGQDLGRSNGHGRAAGLSEPRPAMSNLFFESAQGVSPAELRKKFLESCKAEGREWCAVVKQMDNPALSMQRQDEFAEAFMAGGGGGGDRVPLLVYRVYVADGREELMRGSRLAGLNLRAMRKIAGIGNDAAVYAFQQNPTQGIAGTALGAFGSAQGGLPTTLTAPSLLLDDVEVRGARGEPRRPPLVPPPPMN